MPGKTRIEGTAYDIVPSAVLISGTKYQINEGKTLIGGQTRTIRLQENYPTLGELMEDMEVLGIVGRSSAGAGSLSLASSYVPNNSTGYIFSVCNGDMGIWRVDSINNIRSIYSTPVKLMNTSRGGVVNLNGGNATYYYKNQGYGEGNAMSGNSVYAGTFMIVDFPSYTPSKIDGVLSNTYIQSITGANTGNAMYSNVNYPINRLAGSLQYVLATYQDKIDIWEYNASYSGSVHRINGTTSAAAWLDSSNWLCIGPDLSDGGTWSGGGSLIGLADMPYGNISITFSYSGNSTDKYQSYCYAVIGGIKLMDMDGVENTSSNNWVTSGDIVQFYVCRGNGSSASSYGKVIIDGVTVFEDTTTNGNNTTPYNWTVPSGIVSFNIDYSRYYVQGSTKSGGNLVITTTA